MSDTKLYPFYYPWPNLGVKLSRQWDKLRDNTEKEAPLIRAAYVDAQPSSANEPGEHDLSGWAIGERDFRNKFRIYYDKSADRFSIQYNSGTEDVEIWNDYLSIRQVDGQVTVHGYGGLDTTVGGFYTPLSRNLAVSGTFTPESTEWVWEHSLNTKPILWNTFNLEDKSIIPQSVDVSNPNIAYFYFSQAYAGRAIAVAEVARGDGIRVTDGTNNYTQSTILSFNYGQFYISHGLEGYPTINLQPGAAGASDHGALTGLSDDDHSQYLLASDATDRATFAANWLDLTDGGATTLHSHAAGATDHGTLTGLSDDDHTQYSLADGTRAFTGTVEGIAPTADAHLTTKAYVDTRFADFYRNAVGSDHGGLTGLTDDDHSQYLLASDATNRATFAANWTDLTDGGATTLHSHAVADHGTLSGLSDDDHPQYLLRTEASTGFYGVNFRETDGNPPAFRNDTLIFDSEYFYLQSDSTGKPTVSLRPAAGGGAGVTDHGALTGLSDDDHSQYLLASDATNRATFAANWTDLTDGGETSLHTHPASGGAGGGFYGVNFRETDGGPDFRNDTIYFDSESFYLHPNSVGKPVLSFRGSSSGVSDHGALTGLTDDDHSQYLLASDATNRATFAANWTDLTDGGATTLHSHAEDSGSGGGFYGVNFRETDGGPDFRNDTIYFDSDSFYLHPNSVGKPVLSFRGSAGGAGVSDHGTLTGLTDDDHSQYLLASDATNRATFAANWTDLTDGGATTLHTHAGGSVNINAKHFYFSGSNSVVNLRDEPNVYKGHLPGVYADNIFIEPDAEHAFTMGNATLDIRTGGATVGFYVVSGNNLGSRRGTGIPGMDPITVTSTRTTTIPTSGGTMQVGDRLVMSIIATSGAAQHLVYKVRLQKTN